MKKKKKKKKKEELLCNLQKASSGEWKGFRFTLTTTGFAGAGDGAEQLSAMPKLRNWWL